MWDRIINNATQSVETLKDPECVKQLGNILKTNVRACQAIGHPFVTQLGRIYLDMLNVYQVRPGDLQSIVTNLLSVVFSILLLNVKMIREYSVILGFKLPLILGI